MLLSLKERRRIFRKLHGKKATSILYLDSKLKEIVDRILSPSLDEGKETNVKQKKMSEIPKKIHKLSAHNLIKCTGFFKF